MSKPNIIFLSLLIPIIGSSGSPNPTSTTTNTFIFDEEEFQKLAHDVQHLKDVNEIMRLKLALNAISMKEELAAVKTSIKSVEEMKQILLDRDLKLNDNFSKMIQSLETKILSTVLVNVKSELADLRSSLKDEIGDLKTSIMTDVNSERNSLVSNRRNEIGDLENSLKNHLRNSLSSEIGSLTNTTKSEIDNLRRILQSQINSPSTNDIVELKNSMKGEIGDMKNSIMSNVKSEINKIQPHINTLSASLKNEVGNLKSSLANTTTSELADLRSSLKGEIGDMKNSIMSNVKSEINKIQPQINSLSTSLQKEIVNLRNSLPISVSSEIGHLRETIQPEINRITNISKSCETAVEVKFDKFKNTLLQTQESLAKLSESVRHIPKHYPSCVEALQNGEESGIYKLYLHSSGLEPFDVYCLRDPENGPAWTVFQRRQDGSVDFYRNWQEYKKGFGDLRGEFFLGMEKLYALTNQVKTQQMWIKLSDWEGGTRNARYSRFEIGNETSKYNMTQLGNYGGNAGDSLTNHRGQKFTTTDSDNDNDKNNLNCATHFKGAWWFDSCYVSHLNGPYLRGKSIQSDHENGIVWSRWRGLQYSLKYVHMALRPSN